MSLSEVHKIKNSRYVQTLVDCGCTAFVWKDGSGVEIEYCSLHRHAKEALDALKEASQSLYSLINDKPDIYVKDIDDLISRMEGGE